MRVGGGGRRRWRIRGGRRGRRRIGAGALLMVEGVVGGRARLLGGKLCEVQVSRRMVRCVYSTHTQHSYKFHGGEATSILINIYTLYFEQECKSRNVRAYHVYQL